jgi:hypothetical protein
LFVASRPESKKRYNVTPWNPASPLLADRRDKATLPLALKCSTDFSAR